MKILIHILLILLLSSSFGYCQSPITTKIPKQKLNQKTINKLSEIESYRGIKILDEGPTGSKHFNEKRGEFGCTKFRITIYNDTIVPIELEINFPSHQVSSLPDPLCKVQGWVLPDALTPDTFQNAFNFGITGLEEFFNAEFTDSRTIRATIPPKGHHSFYLTLIGESPFNRGSNYSHLYINGYDFDADYLPVKKIETDNSDINVVDLVWGIGHTPHNLYTLIHCGRIRYLE